MAVMRGDGVIVNDAVNEQVAARMKVLAALILSRRLLSRQNCWESGAARTSRRVRVTHP